ncbi:MAG: sigma-54-dependent Fis family transcriptional regulator [Candidatus Electrothrix sp. AW2]|jgi:two-component system response regulator HydG|nr:sigma-54-dependent Fis family transcriptional regulator [Candidatus Electrothrix sp. AX1]MCI5127091.1 sigma-54-dependent Fis family transcriptional regulator [Candidatus Electrothrix gigas]MCI5135030.1 sigma-54-dependent Fis family transcriptional regulator [Candidatus Electrothrix gigas]MCI5179277.1 sigma-54-dependent Fis family transcriptional regulator [Candidatus Electrothrix gigas]MCI5182758.1 sigma-54-dependent Fis family transcriptional regulator [Candidatus Electrothrix gigas]
MRKKKVKILIVDDEQVHRYMLYSMLTEWGWSCQKADDGETAVAAVRQGPFDVILMDVCMEPLDGLEALRQIHAINPSIPVVMMTAYSSIDSAVEAIKLGAHDYLTKPIDFERLRETLEVAMGHRQQPDKTELPEKPFGEDGRIIGSSIPMQTLWEMIIQVAPTEATVLITGDSGTGKELVASALHYKSQRRKGPFIKVNCAALSETLLESELFGHEKGAFTGADRRREGCFVQAQKGTLFLDEIGETTPAMQAKLLRVLQEYELQRVGGQDIVTVDVRIVTATNRNLEAEVKAGNFREDLYYRLNVVALDMPSLCDREGDIPLLADFFLQNFAKRNKREVQGITPECMDILNRYPWPGNVRELENAIERGVILMRGDYLDIDGLPMAVQNWAGMNPKKEEEQPSTLRAAERILILKTLEETNGNRSEAARRLQITRKTLLNKLKRYGV